MSTLTYSLVLLSLICSVYLGANQEEDGATIKTKLGVVKGFNQKISVRNGKDVTVGTFLGVPYARPPIGDLRLQSTQEIDPWDEEIDATKWPPLCPQEGAFLSAY